MTVLQLMRERLEHFKKNLGAGAAMFEARRLIKENVACVRYTRRVLGTPVTRYGYLESAWSARHLLRSGALEDTINEKLLPATAAP